MQAARAAKAHKREQSRVLAAFDRHDSQRSFHICVRDPNDPKRGSLDAMLERDWNHPSLAIISLVNESWGLDLKQKEQRDWLKAAFVDARKKAKGRLVVDNSACYGNFHLKTDINDYHVYWAIPENWRQFNHAVDDVSRRPPWLFSPRSRHSRTIEM